MTIIYTKAQIDAQATQVGQAIKAAKTTVTQVTGQSTTQVPSQKLFTDEVTNINDKVGALEGISGKVKNTLDDAILSMWVGTQAQLDAIAVKDVTTIYMVKE